MTPREFRILATAVVASAIFAVLLVQGMTQAVEMQLKKLPAEGSSLSQD